MQFSAWNSRWGQWVVGRWLGFNVALQRSSLTEDCKDSAKINTDKCVRKNTCLLLLTEISWNTCWKINAPKVPVDAVNRQSYLLVSTNLQLLNDNSVVTGKKENCYHSMFFFSHWQFFRTHLWTEAWAQTLASPRIWRPSPPRCRTGCCWLACRTHRIQLRRCSRLQKVRRECWNMLGSATRKHPATLLLMSWVQKLFFPLLHPQFVNFFFFHLWV